MFREENAMIFLGWAVGGGFAEDVVRRWGTSDVRRDQRDLYPDTDLYGRVVLSAALRGRKTESK